MRGTTLINGRQVDFSCLFICTGYIQFWLCGGGFNGWFGCFCRCCQFLQQTTPLFVSMVYDWTSLAVTWALRVDFTKLEWLHPNIVTLGQAGQILCCPVVLFGLGLLVLLQLSLSPFQVCSLGQQQALNCRKESIGPLAQQTLCWAGYHSLHGRVSIVDYDKVWVGSSPD